MKPVHRLEVMAQNGGLRIHHDLERVFITLEVRDEHFHGAPRNLLVDARDRVGVDAGTTVRELVAIHARDDDVLQRHLFHGLGDPARLVLVEFGRHPVGNATVLARPCAYVTKDHEGGGTSFPAFADVRAAGLFANRMQALRPHHPLEVKIIRAAG